MCVSVAVCHTLRLVLDRGWLMLLYLHGSEEVSTDSLWRSGVIPSVPGSWNMPMEIGRSFLDTDTKERRDDSKEKKKKSNFETKEYKKCLRDWPVG